MPRFKEYQWDAMAARWFTQNGMCSPNIIAIDTETSGFAFYDEAFCVTLSWRDPERGVVNVYMDLQYDEAGTRHAMVRQMLDLAGVWVFHNAKFDLQKLELAGVLPDNWRSRAIEDTAIMHALIDENDRHGLKYLAAKYLGESTNEEKVLVKVRRKRKIKKDEGYHLLPREVVVPYAMKDTEFTLRLWEKLRSTFPGALHDLYAAEVDVSLALLDIEAQGIGLDVPYLERTASEYGVRVMKLTRELQELARDPNGAQFNPNSPKQIMEAFERRGVIVSATDKATLKTIDDALADTLLEYRNVKKMHATYLTGMLKEQVDGVIHPNFNTTLPRTGRMSSSAASNN